MNLRRPRLYTCDEPCPDPDTLRTPLQVRREFPAVVHRVTRE
jgi:hypothetical protein